MEDYLVWGSPIATERTVIGGFSHFSRAGPNYRPNTQMVAVLVWRVWLLPLLSSRPSAIWLTPGPSADVPSKPVPLQPVGVGMASIRLARLFPPPVPLVVPLRHPYWLCCQPSKGPAVVVWGATALVLPPLVQPLRHGDQLVVPLRLF